MLSYVYVCMVKHMICI